MSDDLDWDCYDDGVEDGWKSWSLEDGGGRVTTDQAERLISLPLVHHGMISQDTS